MAFDIALLIGRIIVGAYYAYNGINHFTHFKMLVGYAKSKNVPMPQFLVPFSGLLLLLGGLSFLLGVYPQLGVVCIIAFLLPVSFTMHSFWNVPSDQRMTEQIQFMKNMALLGSTLMFLAIGLPWAYSWNLF